MCLTGWLAAVGRATAIDNLSLLQTSKTHRNTEKRCGLASPSPPRSVQGHLSCSSAFVILRHRHRICWRLSDQVLVGPPQVQGSKLLGVLSRPSTELAPSSKHVLLAALPPHNHQKQRPEKDAGEQHPTLCFTRDTGTRDTQTVCLWSEHELIKLCMCVQLRPKQTGWTTALHLQ